MAVLQTYKEETYDMIESLDECFKQLSDTLNKIEIEIALQVDLEVNYTYHEARNEFVTGAKEIVERINKVDTASSELV